MVENALSFQFIYCAIKSGAKGDPGDNGKCFNSFTVQLKEPKVL